MSTIIYHTRIALIQILFLLAVLFLPFQSHAQLTIADTISTIQQLQTLFGAGVTISNLQTTCDTTIAMGEFNGLNSNIGLPSGVIISTGNISDAPGPNLLGSTSTALGTPGDPQLNALIPGFTTFDACVIEFDIVPLCDTIAIRYVFGSEEYPEFVFSSFNDAFAFFISGPGIAGTQNIALVPGTVTPVTIDNVNGIVNSQYYVDNVGGSTVEFDGFTVPLLASAQVIPCQTYHIKIAIADAGDQIYDSAVFLEAGGIGCTGQILSISSGNTLNFGGNVAVEGCVDGFFEFTVPLANTVDDTFYYSIGGTAISGLDYVPIPDSVIMLAGQTSVMIPVTVVNDGLIEGQEIITLIYVDSVLCSSQIISDTISLFILDPPTSYAGVDTVLCSGDTIPIGVPSLTGFTYQWNPSTGISNPTSPDPLITLTNTSGSPIVLEYVLTTTALLGGCESEDTIHITVDDIIADFTVDTVCEGNPSNFANLSTGGSTAGWAWDYGDGNGSALQDPAYVYALPGTYLTQLVATSALGCKDTAAANAVVDPLPIVAFSAPATCLGTFTQFMDNTNIATAWKWDFGDGNSSSIQNPSHLYAAPGTFYVQLIATTGDGCIDSLTQAVNVYAPPVAAFSADSVCLGFPVQFNDLSGAGSGNISVYDWDFGDLTSSALQSPVHTYGNFGTFASVLIVTDVNGCSDTITHPVTIHPPVSADFSFTQACFGDTTSFNDLSVFDPSGPIQQWSWDFGDGNASAVPSPDHFYTVFGTYNVQLNVLTVDGCADTEIRVVDVFDQPIADFSFVSVCDGEAVSFTDLSNFNNPNVNWSWDFGDATGSASQNPVHTFPDFGVYTVSLTVTNNNGCDDTFTQQIEVYPVPEALFSVADVCLGDWSVFTNQSNVDAPGQIVNYAWDFGDGQQSAQQNPSHTYNLPGLYTVILQVRTQTECEDVYSRVVRVYPRPSVQFEKEDVCLGEITHFTDLSTVDGSLTGDVVNAWQWDFNDGNTSGDQNPEHIYSQPGNYQVTLTAVTDKGCTKSRTKKVIVFAPPVVPLVGNDTVCFGDPAFLSASASSDVEVLWFEHANDATPFHTGYSYVSPQVPYEQTWFVQSVHKEKGCKSIRVPVTAFLRNDLNGSILASNNLLEIPNAVVDLSVSTSTNIASFDWNFGDGNQSADAAPRHTYTHPGKYEVLLNLIDVYGCETQLSYLIEVKEVVSLYIPSAFSPNGDGVNDEFFVVDALIENLDIRIYNRWGTQVFMAAQMGFRWNGTGPDGQPLPEGVYIYHMKARDIHGKEIIKSGSITLIR